MVVIFYHTADGNLNLKALKHLQGNVNLSPAAIHHDQIRKSCKASECRIGSFRLQLLRLRKSMGETAGQHFPHGCIIIRALNSFYAELPVIIPLWPAVLINNHGTD